MATTKASLLKQATSLGLELSTKNTIAEIKTAIADAEKATDKIAPKTEATEAIEEALDGNNGDVADDTTEGAAKAGKRSAKSLKAAEEKAGKEARKLAGDTSAQAAALESHGKKGPAPITRPRNERRGKKYRQAAMQVEAGRTYALAEALALAAATNPATFDASVEVHVLLGVDPRQADQNVRATVSLPHGTGKTIRVAAMVPADEAAAATKAGAVIAGEEAVTALLDKQQLDFDILVATPQLMPRLGKYARLLGPRGLMPNPKSGTVATNASAAIREAKAGRVEYRVDKQAIVHLAIGKVSFGGDKLTDNARSFFESLLGAKPTSIKGTYLRTISVSTTMGPGIAVDITTVSA